MEALHEHLGPKSGEFYASYGVVPPGESAPRDEPTQILAFACAYPPELHTDRGTYMLLGAAEDIERLPDRSALRRRILSYEVRPGATETQDRQARIWSNPISRQVVLVRAYEKARSQELPVCFIALGRAESDNRLVGLIFHPPEIITTAALDLVRESVEQTMAQDIG